jgi:hypothetical protein
MTIPRQLHTIADLADLNLERLDARITALESSGNVASANPFNKRLGSRSKLASRLNNLNSRTTALEASSTARRDWDVRLARRSPLGKALADLDHRLTVLE